MTKTLREAIEEIIYNKIELYECCEEDGSWIQGQKESVDTIMIEIKRRMPKRKSVTEHECNTSSWCLVPECNFNNAITETLEAFDGKQAKS